jgi:thiol:disulfide interchange protein DsbC
MMLSGMAFAAGDADNLKIVADKISKAFPEIKIDAIRKAPVPGLYEISIGRNVFYSDLNGDYALVGTQILELSSHRNLTRERVQELSRAADLRRQKELSRFDWSILPLDKAIVSGDKDAKLKVAVFTDPDCPFCQKLEKELKRVKGVAVYTFLFPLPMHPAARGKAEAIWCSKNRHEALLQVILDQASLEVEKCDTPIDEIAALGKKLGVTGTPTLFSGDWRMSAGWKTAEQLEEWLAKK